MIAIDTNILVYAHRRDSRWHDLASKCVGELAEGPRPWMIPWPCIHEFLAISTHPRIYDPPTPMDSALLQVDYWMESPSLAMLGESPAYWRTFRRIAAKSRLAGPVVHDARIAAICLDHGVDVLFTADRDFSKFPGLKTRNPLVA